MGEALVIRAEFLKSPDYFWQPCLGRVTRGPWKNEWTREKSYHLQQTDAGLYIRFAMLLSNEANGSRFCVGSAQPFLLMESFSPKKALLCAFFNTSELVYKNTSTVAISIVKRCHSPEIVVSPPPRKGCETDCWRFLQRLSNGPVTKAPNGLKTW